MTAGGTDLTIALMLRDEKGGGKLSFFSSRVQDRGEEEMFTLRFGEEIICQVADEHDQNGSYTYSENWTIENADPCIT